MCFNNVASFSLVELAANDESQHSLLLASGVEALDTASCMISRCLEHHRHTPVRLWRLRQAGRGRTLSREAGSLCSSACVSASLKAVCGRTAVKL